MKKLSALWFLALGLCLLPTINAADKKTAPQAAPKVPDKVAAKDVKAAPEPEKPIVGALIERKDGSGGFLNLRVDGGNFVIAFLDKDKKEVEGNLFRGIIRYRRHLQNKQFILTRAADGKTLRSPLPVDKPYLFASLPVVLFKEGEENVSETYMVALHQPMPGDGEGIPVDEMTPEQLQQIAK